MLKINSLLLLSMILLSYSVSANDLIESQSIRAKIINIENIKVNKLDKEVLITIELDGKEKTFPFSPFKLDYVMYKNNLSTLPIMKTKLGNYYYIELGTYATAEKKDISQKIYYIGEKAFSFGELE